MMMRKKAVAEFLSIVLVLAFGTLSCAGMKGREKGAAVGAAVGAATGAMIGAAIGHQSHDSGEGAGVGAVFGGLLGGAIGSMLGKESVEEVKKETPPPPPVAKKEEAVPAPPIAKEEVLPPPPPPEVKAEEAPAPMPTEEVAAVEELKDIHFDFDKYDIRSDAQPILENNAKWIKENPQAMIQLQGHCDERGTIEYNLALGERRARSTRDYMVSLGVDPQQLSTISYGEEKPLDSQHNEEAWAKNRRTQFVILK